MGPVYTIDNAIYTVRNIYNVDGRAEQLINNCNYWEIINLQPIIVMSIIHMVYKKSDQKLHHAAGCLDTKCNIKTVKNQSI